MSVSSQEHKATAPKQLGFDLIVCSTSRYALAQAGKPVEDPSGDLIVEMLESIGHTVVSRVVVADDAKMILNALNGGLRDENVQAIVLCGGTGIAPNDVTIETVAPILRKTLPGFGEAFRRLSFDSMGSATILSRAVAGIAQGKAIFCIPGSIDAVKLCLGKLILPEAGHIVKHAREG